MLTLIDPPIDMLFTLAEAKLFLRVDHSEDDDVITALIAAATSRFDGREGVLGRCLLPQRWRFDCDGFPSDGEVLRVPLPPTIAVETVQYYNTAGTLTTWSAALWREVAGGWHGTSIIPVVGASWPSEYADAMPDKVQVTFRAGYSDSLSPQATVHAVPEAIRLAARMLIAEWYDNRLNTVISATVAEMPYAVSMLIAPFRVIPIS